MKTYFIFRPDYFLYYLFFLDGLISNRHLAIKKRSLQVDRKSDWLSNKKLTSQERLPRWSQPFISVNGRTRVSAEIQFFQPNLKNGQYKVCLPLAMKKSRLPNLTLPNLSRWSVAIFSIPYQEKAHPMESRFMKLSSYPELLVLMVNVELERAKAEPESRGSILGPTT